MHFFDGFSTSNAQRNHEPEKIKATLGAASTRDHGECRSGPQLRQKMVR